MPRLAQQGGKTTRVKNPEAPRLPAALREAEMPRDDFENDAIIRHIRYDGQTWSLGM